MTEEEFIYIMKKFGQKDKYRSMFNHTLFRDKYTLKDFILYINSDDEGPTYTHKLLFGRIHNFSDFSHLILKKGANINELLIYKTNLLKALYD